MSQNEKTPGRVAAREFYRGHGIAEYAYNSETSANWDRSAAAVIAHHEAGKALGDRVAESVAQDVQAMRCEIDALRAQLSSLQAERDKAVDERNAWRAKAMDGENVEAIRARVAELEGLLIAQDKDALVWQTRVNELEAQLAASQAEVARLKAEVERVREIADSGLHLAERMIRRLDAVRHGTETAWQDLGILRAALEGRKA